MRGWHFKGHNYAAHDHGIDQWFITLGDMREDGSFPFVAPRKP